MLRERGRVRTREPRAEPRRAARPRRARHRRRRRAARPHQPHPRRRRACAHPRRPRAAGHRGAVRGRGPRLRARDRVRPRLRRRAAAQRGRTARRHVARHPLPARRRRRARRAPLARRARPPEPRAARRRGDDAGRGARRRSTRRRPATADAYTVCLYRPQWHPGRGRHRRLAPQGPLPPAGDRVRARAPTASCRARAARSPASTCATRSTSSRSARPGVLERFGGHAFAAGVDAAARRDCRAFAAAFEDGRARDARRPTHLRRPLETDGELAAGELTFALARSLRAGVWGQGFPPPAFDDEFDVGDQRRRRRARTRGSRSSAAGERVRRDPVRPGRAAARRGSTRLYRPEVNEWNGLQSLELVIEHWASAVGLMRCSCERMARRPSGRRAASARVESQLIVYTHIALIPPCSRAEYVMR